MHDLAFADAARPTPVVVLKLPLLPYSLGHELHLLRRRNPLLLLPPVKFNELPRFDQERAVSSAVWICANTWQQNEREPFLWIKQKIWGRRTRGENVSLAIADFRNYLAQGKELPPAPDKEVDEILNGKDDSKNRAFGAPLLANLIQFAIADCGLRIAETWDQPYAFMAWLYFSKHESEGRYRIQNFAEWDERMNLDKIDADISREKAEGRHHSQRASAGSSGLATPPPNFDIQPEPGKEGE